MVARAASIATLIGWACLVGVVGLTVDVAVVGADVTVESAEVGGSEAGGVEVTDTSADFSPIGGSDYFWCALAQTGKWFALGHPPLFIGLSIAGGLACGFGI